MYQASQTSLYGIYSSFLLAEHFFSLLTECLDHIAEELDWSESVMLLVQTALCQRMMSVIKKKRDAVVAVVVVVVDRR